MFSISPPPCSYLIKLIMQSAGADRHCLLQFILELSSGKAAGYGSFVTGSILNLLNITLRSLEKKHKSFTILFGGLRNSHSWYLIWTSQEFLSSPYNRIVTAT